MNKSFQVVLGAAIFWLLTGPLPAAGGPYLDSAHGDSAVGVKRFPLASTYSQGNCAHCHEMHGSIEGSEPAPVDNEADPYALFYESFTSQTDNFCFKCHGAPSYQSGGLVNRSYSYRAGGWTDDTLNDILEAFSYSAPGTSHNLVDISSFITSKWNYTAASNPCGGCHNPHAVQGDPEGAGSSAKTSTTRGYPLARPSEHDDAAWDVWGDDSGEKMSDYATAVSETYMAPRRYPNSATAHEPDGTTTDDGTNLTDMNTFCLDCHASEVPTDNAGTTSVNPGTSANKLTDLSTGTTWTLDKHGDLEADVSLHLLDPYGTTLGRALACTDCHEPHGAPNNFLIRKEVNGGVLSDPVSSGNGDYGYLCRQCHMDDAATAACGTGAVNGWEYIHHQDDDAPYNQIMCTSCHEPGFSPDDSCGNGQNKPKIACSDCHYHGSTVNDATKGAASRTTF